jgi:hypothetical protein
VTKFWKTLMEATILFPNRVLLKGLDSLERTPLVQRLGHLRQNLLTTCLGGLNSRVFTKGLRSGEHSSRQSPYGIKPSNLRPTESVVVLHCR